MTHNLYHKDPPLHFYHLQLTTLVSSGTSCAILCVPSITQREMMWPTRSHHNKNPNNNNKDKNVIIWLLCWGDKYIWDLSWIINTSLIARDGNGVGQGWRMGSSPPPRIDFSYPIPAPPRMTGKISCPIPAP